MSFAGGGGAVQVVTSTTITANARIGSLLGTLDYTRPPERDEAKLDALAWHILY